METAESTDAWTNKNLNLKIELYVEPLEHRRSRRRKLWFEVELAVRLTGGSVSWKSTRMERLGFTDLRFRNTDLSRSGDGPERRRQ